MIIYLHIIPVFIETGHNSRTICSTPTLNIDIYSTNAKAEAARKALGGMVIPTEACNLKGRIDKEVGLTSRDSHFREHQLPDCGEDHGRPYAYIVLDVPLSDFRSDGEGNTGLEFTPSEEKWLTDIEKEAKVRIQV